MATWRSTGSGRVREAIAQFRLAIGLREGYYNARFNLANALAKSGNLDEAIEDAASSGGPSRRCPGEGTAGCYDGEVREVGRSQSFVC